MFATAYGTPQPQATAASKLKEGEAAEAVKKKSSLEETKPAAAATVVNTKNIHVYFYHIYYRYLCNQF
jgi:hypothetical protein